MERFPDVPSPDENSNYKNITFRWLQYKYENSYVTDSAYISSSLHIFVTYENYVFFSESNINMVGNVFSFVATKYPKEWYWKLVKVSGRLLLVK
jgi:hypothetical protein